MVPPRAAAGKMPADRKFVVNLRRYFLCNLRRNFLTNLDAEYKKFGSCVFAYLSATRRGALRDRSPLPARLCTQDNSYFLATGTCQLSQPKRAKVREIRLYVNHIFIFDADRERRIHFLSWSLGGFYKGHVLPRLFFIFSNGLDGCKLLKILYRLILTLIAVFQNFLGILETLQRTSRCRWIWRALGCCRIACRRGRCEGVS